MGGREFLEADGQFFKNSPISPSYLAAPKELEAIKARVREMEEEAEKLKELQNEVEKQMNMSPPPGNGK